MGKLNMLLIFFFIASNLYLVTCQNNDCENVTVADIVFLVDGSSSIGKSNFEEMKGFMQSFIENFGIGSGMVQIGVAQFTDKPYNEFALNSYSTKEEILKAVNNLKYRDGKKDRRTGLALEFLQSKYFTQSAGSRKLQNVPQIAIVFTEGESSDNVSEAAQALRDKGITIYAIGIRIKHFKELKQIVSLPSHKFIFNVDRYRALKNEMSHILETVCTAARAEIMATSRRVGDIVFLVDSSQKMGRSGFLQAKEFIKNIVDLLEIGPDAFRIGLAQYSENPKEEFLFNRYQNASEIKNYINKKFGYTGGPLNTGKAINFLSSTFFQESAGSRIRDGYPQYAVILASSKSEDNARLATRKLKEKGVKVVVIGGQEDAMKDFETSGQRVFFKSSSSQGFDKVSKNITNIFDGSYSEELVTSIVCNQAKVADIVFLVDASTSIGQMNFQRIRDFLNDMVDKLDVDEKKVRIGIVLYSTQSQVELFLKDFNNKTDILNRIKNLPYIYGNTLTGTAITYMRKNVFNENAGSRAASGVQQIAVIITDGESQDSVDKPAADLRNQGVTVYAVGIRDASKTELQNIVSLPANEHIIMIENFQELESIKEKFSKQICSSIVSLSSVPVAPCEECTDIEKADIYFLISGSGHMGDDHFQEFTDIKNFMIDMIDLFEIGPDRVRVGVVQYSDAQQMEFSIDQYNKKVTIQEAIRGIKQNGSGTQTGKALNFVLKQFQDPAKKRTQTVSQILIIITDQKSQDDVSRPAAVLRNAGIKVYAVGIHQAVKEQLEQIAKEKERIFFVPNSNYLSAVRKYIIQEICYEEACKIIKADVIFLLENSGAIDDAEFGNMRTLIKSLVDDSNIGQDAIQVGLIQFNSQAEVVLRLNQFFSKTEILDKIENLTQQSDGNINIGEALKRVSAYFGKANGGRPHFYQYLIIVTHSKASDEYALPAEALQKQGINIISVGAGYADITQLQQLSGNRLRTFYTGRADDLYYLTRPILLSMCTIDETCKKTVAADIIFLVDGSNSIDTNEYLQMKQFMEAIVNNTEVGENKVKFGAVIYSNTPKVMFKLQDFLTKTEIRQAIYNMSKEDASTYTAMALDYTKEYFAEKHGGRKQSNISQILVVITDGIATDNPYVNSSALAIRNADIIIYAIGVDRANASELELMAGSKERFFYVSDFNKLVEIQKDLSKSLCKDIKQACFLEIADIVFLIDASEHITADDFNITKEFLKETISSFAIGQDRVHVGLCQYSSAPKKVFYLNEIYEKNKLHKKIDQISQTGNATLTGTAMNYVRQFFETSLGGRKTEGTPQILLVITTGGSQDDVSKAAQELLSSRVKIFSVGIGKASLDELTEIAGQPNKTLYVPSFQELRKERKRVVRNICTKPCCESRECTIDILVGFDKSTYSLSFPTQKELQDHLPRIIERASSLSGVSCGLGFQPTIRFSFLVLAEGYNTLVNSSFEKDYQNSLQFLLNYTTGETTLFREKFLNIYFNDLSQRSAAKVKILLLFTDGLEVNVTYLKNIARTFETKGKNERIHALFMVPLQNAKDISAIKSLEFGRIFKEGQPEHTEIKDFPEVFLQNIESLAERECCNVFCKCDGPPGYAGNPGTKGTKGDNGLKGVRGHEGEEGTSGNRGPPGPLGIQGPPGCQGNRGSKGERGYSGAKGSNGGDGLNGISGEEGDPGTPGRSAEKGDPGAMGRRGLRGEPGERGSDGIRGDPGTPGQNSRISGPKGTKGNPGVQGSTGTDGISGPVGYNGNTGPTGRRGSPGLKGERGPPGTDGPDGDPGLQGKQGNTGEKGFKGAKGASGRQGVQGDPGPGGVKGSAGRLGPTGLKGEQGEFGAKGEQGLRGTNGIPGTDGRDGYGIKGRKGIKGQRGFPGNSGIQGDDGDPGSPGGEGGKGNRGRQGDSGPSGDDGEPGTSGPKGPRGPKGPSGSSPWTPCQLVSFVRNNSCTRGIKRCPAFPTELVFALDMSNDVQPEQFRTMKTIMKSILDKLHVRENNCPIGARVTVVSYNKHTKYAIRFSDYKSKTQLMQAVEDLTLRASSTSRSIGTAVRFVGRNAFKRFHPSIFTRKIAIFFTGGDATNLSEINTAVLEYKALDIIPVIVALRQVPNIKRAFQLDDTRKFRVFDLTKQDVENVLLEIRKCTICFDPCVGDMECETAPGPFDVDMDLAFVLDSSQNINTGQLKTATDFIGKIIDQLPISPAPQTARRGARIALVQHSPLRYAPQRGQAAVKLEFDFLTYRNGNLMKRHLQTKVNHLQGASAIGHAIEWTVTNIFNKVQNPKTLKVIFAVVSGKTSSWDKKKLREMSLQYRCLGYSIFTLAIGKDFSNSELYELSSTPREQHFIHLGAVLELEMQFAERFVQTFFNLLKSGMNKYPPPDLQEECRRRPVISLNEESGQTEIEEYFEEITAPPNEEGEIEYEADQASIPSIPYEYNNEEAMIPPETNAGYKQDYSDYINGTGWDLMDTVSRTAKDICQMDLDEGPCQEYSLMWYYDRYQIQCKRFWYGGCGGNENRFETKTSCEEFCTSLF